MSSLAKKYAEGLYNAATAESGTQNAVANAFLELMRRRGQQKILASVLSEYKKIANAAARRQKAVVRVANEKEGRGHNKEIECTLQELGVTEAERVVDERLIGGVRIETHGAEYDRTYRSALVKLFRSLITE